MKVYVALLIVAFSLTSCFKNFEGINDNNELFAKLSKGNGTWQIVKVEEWDPMQSNPTVTTSNPDNTFFHFYVRSKIVSGSVIQLDYGEYYLNNVLAFETTVSAQKERIVFEGTGGAFVYSVESNGRKNLVWLQTLNDKAYRIYLQKCDCDVPNSDNTETNG